MKQILFLIVLLTGCSSMPETPERLWALQNVHNAMLAKHVYISDMEQYGVIDKWAVSLRGDCEDYALYLQSIVGGDLLKVITKEGVLHMVLLQHGYIIDNTSKSVYPYLQMKHKFVSRVN